MKLADATKVVGFKNNCRAATDPEKTTWSKQQLHKSVRTRLHGNPRLHPLVETNARLTFNSVHESSRWPNRLNSGATATLRLVRL
jgi:hypothetical protein